jgi:ABC-2 type transport system ATP-binding protein
MTEAGKAIAVSGISKQYGSATVVDNVTFDVFEGEIFGFLGPNGAGKTTLVRMLTTLIAPSRGTAMVAGFDVVKEPAAVRRQIGVIPQAMTSDTDLTGYENVDIYGRFYGISAKERKERIRYLLEKVGLSNRADDLVAAYSGGMRRRLEIARVLVHQPKILFLDEPTSGLDPQSRRAVWEQLDIIRRESAMTLFLTTHYMEEAEALCTRVAIVDAGKIIVLGTPQELKQQLPGKDTISLALEGFSDAIGEGIKSLPFVHRIYVEENNVRIAVNVGASDLPGVMDAVRAAGGKVLSASIHEQSLEDVFIHFTGRSIRDEAPRKVSRLSAGMIQRPGR